MKTKYLFIAAIGVVTLASCADDVFVGDNSPNVAEETTANDGAILFGLNLPKMTRAGEWVGADAAAKLGGMFVVEGTKGTEQGPATNPATDPSPSINVVFDNYLVGYEYNSAGRTESNTNNWEYVGKEEGITNRMTDETWEALHPDGKAQSQTIKYWDYSVDQYDFIAWSTGTCEAIPFPTVAAEPASKKIQVSRINTGNTLVTNGFSMRASNADDLLECYYTDIITVEKGTNGANYGKPVTLTFKNMAAKVRVALYETVPGYSVKDVKFYSADCETNGDPTKPGDLGTGSDVDAVLYTTGGNVLPQSGTVLVYYPHIGTAHKAAGTKDYNKASVTVTPGDATSTTQAFDELDYQSSRVKEGLEPNGDYLGYTLPTATYAGDKAVNYYQAVVPNTNGYPLTLRVDYTLVSTDGNAEEIKVYGAKAVVPATYTEWQPNYAYTYIFKISDNTNGWTSTDPDDEAGLFPITFDAVVTSFIDANAEQTTVTTVASPSITTYQQGHDHANKNEYSKSQIAGLSNDVKDVYVQVMNNSGATPSLVADLDDDNSLLFKVSKADASEAEVMDALKNRTNTISDDDPIGRNGITLTKDDNISNTEVQIVNGVDDQPITKNPVTGNNFAAGQIAMIDIDQLASTGTYAYVYCTTVPQTEEKIYNVVSDETAQNAPANYYEVDLNGTETPITSSTATAAADKVYFVKNVDANGDFVSYTFKQTKVGDNVKGLVEAAITTKTVGGYKADVTSGTTLHFYFYFDVYNQNDGEYAVKVIKVVG